MIITLEKYNLYECQGSLFVDGWHSCDVIKIKSIKDIDVSSYEVLLSNNNIVVIKIGKETLRCSDNEKIFISITHEVCTTFDSAMGSCGNFPRHYSDATFLIFTTLSKDYLMQNMTERGVHCEGVNKYFG